MGMAIPIPQSSVGGWGLGSLIPQTISQGFSFVGQTLSRYQVSQQIQATMPQNKSCSWCLSVLVYWVVIL